MRAQHFAASAGVLLVLAGCSAAPPTAVPRGIAGPASDQASGLQRCNFEMLGTNTFAPGGTILFRFTAQRDSQWCYGGLRLGGISIAGQYVASPPRHGQVRLEHVPGAIALGYRPEPGFVGTDTISIGFDVDGLTTYFNGRVTVIPPPAAAAAAS